MEGAVEVYMAKLFCAKILLDADEDSRTVGQKLLVTSDGSVR
jgi:hypothetical protein